MAVGGDRAEFLAVFRCDGMEIDAIEVITRFLCRDGEARALDHFAQRASRQSEAVRHLVGSDVGKVRARQTGKLKSRRACCQVYSPAAFIHSERHLRAIGQFAHDVVEHVRRHSGFAGRISGRGNGLAHLDVQIRRLEAEHTFARSDVDIGQYRDRHAPLDDARHMLKGLEQRGPFDRQSHGRFPWNSLTGSGARRAGFTPPVHACRAPTGPAPARGTNLRACQQV